MRHQNFVLCLLFFKGLYSRRAEGSSGLSASPALCLEKTAKGLKMGLWLMCMCLLKTPAVSSGTSSVPSASHTILWFRRFWRSLRTWCFVGFLHSLHLPAQPDVPVVIAVAQHLPWKNHKPTWCDWWRYQCPVEAAPSSRCCHYNSHGSTTNRSSSALFLEGAFWNRRSRKVAQGHIFCSSSAFIHGSSAACLHNSFEWA